MTRPILMSLAAVLASGFTPAESAGPPTLAWPIAAKQREELDRLARAQPRPTVAEGKAILAGAVPGFLLTALDLPASEELRRAQDAHSDLLKRQKVVATPAAAQRLLDRLVKEVPPHQRPKEFRYSLTVLDRPETATSSPGGGHVHVTRGMVDLVLADRDRGESALAFLLAREIGHSALGHCRRGWQRVTLEEDAQKSIDGSVPPGSWRDFLETKVKVTGAFVEFLYSPNQECRADLFALQLCRNAGFDLDQSIDGMRFLAAGSKANGLGRLKRLLLERDGDADPESDFGLFCWDRSRQEFTRCRPGEVGKGQRPIVFVHGLYGTNESWLAFLDHFGGQKSVEGRPLLVFRHPGNGSLARSGLLLSKQVKSVIGSPDRATFVCHSAGGLVFRWYAEKLGGAFDRAVLLATPHLGSNLTELKFLVDVQEFLGAARFGLNDGIERIIAEGSGEIGQDLHPDSLFLRALGRNPKAAARYHVFYGEWMTPGRARMTQALFLTVNKALEPLFAPSLPEGILRRQAERFVARLVLPAEILRGDCIVSTKSAKLAGAGGHTMLKLRHLAFRSDPEAIRLVLEAITR